MTNLFITGMSRSGTTLLADSINFIEGTTILNQPFPYFFRYAKKKFFDKINYPETYYVLNNYFNETKYELNNLSKFIENFTLYSTEITQLFEEMNSFSGSISKFTSNLIKNNLLNNYNFIDFFSMFLKKYVSDATKIIGFKEIQCEEFIPNFIKHNWKVLFIIRNPLDVLSSIHYGKGSHYIGERRPTLFHLRNWRKSANMAIEFSEYSNFQIIRYEDLVSNFAFEMQQIYHFINNEKDDFSIEIESIINNLQSNSSFDFEVKGINEKTINRYKNTLPLEMQNYISLLCQAEMNYFNYTKKIDKNLSIFDFKEPFEIENNHFEQNFSSKSFNLELEMQRLDQLQSKIEKKNEESSFFISSRVFEKLAKAI